MLTDIQFEIQCVTLSGRTGLDNLWLILENVLYINNIQTTKIKLMLWIKSTFSICRLFDQSIWQLKRCTFSDDIHSNSYLLTNCKYRILMDILRRFKFSSEPYAKSISFANFEIILIVYYHMFWILNSIEKCTKYSRFSY